MTSGQQGLRSGATGLAAEKTAKILVVDDEDIIRVLLDEILSEEGYQVFQATDGREALHLMEKQTFDLIISDMVMPEVGGIEVLQAAFRIDPHYAVHDYWLSVGGDRCKASQHECCRLHHNAL